jgi:hypothetical protein
VNLRVRSTRNNTLLRSAVGQETICEKGLDRFVPAVCKAIQAFGWDNAEDRPCRKGFPDKEGETPWLAYWLGGKLRVFGLLDWRLRGFSNMGVEIAFGVEAKFGIGFGILVGEYKAPGNWFSIDICSPIVGRKASLRGFGLGGELAVCVDVGLESITVAIEKPLEYYRAWGITASRSACFKTSGPFISDPTVEIRKEVTNTLTKEGLLAFVEGIKITVTPAVKLVIKADVQGKL